MTEHVAQELRAERLDLGVRALRRRLVAAVLVALLREDQLAGAQPAVAFFASARERNRGYQRFILRIYVLGWGFGNCL